MKKEIKPVLLSRYRLDVINNRQTLEAVAIECNRTPEEMRQLLGLDKKGVKQEPKTIIKEKTVSVKRLKAHNTIDSLLGQGLSDQKIADKLGVHRVTVTRYRLGLNLESSRDSKSEDISKLYAKGFNDRQISEELGIHINTVYLWRKRNKKGAHTIR